ncbi:hypothetical protein M9H77_22655 [Catharanthus roseus]|uniref:Uncharacterized protein n=1 Tax=Catharanthus roseus TaxID=4058 RepID=A0ACC0ATL7_CATRO|nr:hypothetical protein M9H77_22655 [Catharanthus roseus]
MVKTKNANVGREGHGEEGGSSRGGHKSSITNMYSFVMLAMHEHRKMNFGYIAIEHMLATQSSSTKCLPYGCFLTKVFQHFKITFFGPNDHIKISKIYNQNTFKRMGFSRNEDGRLIRGGQEEVSENSEKGEEEEGNEPEESNSKTEVERIRKETRRKKRQKRTEEGSSSSSMNQFSLYRTNEESLKSQGYTLRSKRSW